MTEIKIKKICKITSIMLVILSLLMILSTKLEFRNDGKKLNGLEMLSYLQLTMDYYYEELSIPYLLSHPYLIPLGEIAEDLDDSSISVGDVLTISAAKSDLKNGSIDQETMFYYATNNMPILYYPQDVYQDNLVIWEIISWLAILIFIVSIVVVILHITNCVLPGVSLVVLDIIWLFLTCTAAGLLNLNYATVYINITPFLGAVFSIAAMFIWIFRDTITKKYLNGELRISGIGRSSVDTAQVKSVDAVIKDITVFFRNKVDKSVNKGMNISSMKVENTNNGILRCHNCGSELRDGSVFCHICGTKYEEYPESEYVENNEKADEPDYSIESEKKIYCLKCGAELDSDALFCGKCGEKR